MTNLPMRVIAMPQGYLPFGASALSAKYLRIAISFIPQLDGLDGHINDPEFRALAHWPDVLSKTTFDVCFLSGAAALDPVRRVSRDTESDDLQSCALDGSWDALTSVGFLVRGDTNRKAHDAKGSLPLRRAGGTLAGAALHSAAIAGYVVAQRNGEAQVELLRARNRATAPPLVVNAEAAKSIQEIQHAYDSSMALQLSSAQVRSARRRPGIGPPPKPRDYETDINAELTFHDVQQRMFQYPTIRARCGFLAFVKIPITQVPAQATSVYVRPNFPSEYSNVVAVSPALVTSFDYVGSNGSGRGGWPESTARIVAGLVNIGGLQNENPADTVFSFDCLHPAVDLQAMSSDSKTTTQAPESSSISGGALVVASSAIRRLLDDVRTKHMDADALQTKLRAAVVAAPFDATLPLSVEDVTRGFAADIRDRGRFEFDKDNAYALVESNLTNGKVMLGAWETVCGRNVTMKRHRRGFLGIFDHAFPGFSEVAPLPLGATTQSDAGEDGLYVQDVLLRYANDSPVTKRKESATAQPRKTSVSINATAGALPEILFGHTYDVRLRALDAAGGSPFSAADNSPDVAGSQFLPPPVAFARFAAIAAPELRARKPLNGKRDRLNQIKVCINDLNADVSNLEDARLIHPSNVPAVVAEMHDMFSDDPTNDYHVKRYLKRIPSGGNVSYPDPMITAVVVAVTGPQFVKGVAQNITIPLELPFRGTWPRLVPIKIRLLVSANLPAESPWTFEKNGSIFTVTARPGIDLSAQMWSVVDTSKLAHMALLQARFFGNATDYRRQVIERINKHQPTFVCPARDFSLTAATKKPYGNVTFTSADITDRQAEKAFATVTIKATFPFASSDSVDIHAEWPSWRRDPDGLPERFDDGRVVTKVAPQPTFGVPDAQVLIDQPVTISFADSLSKQFRNIRYRLVARSRYIGLFPDQKDEEAFSRTFPADGDPEHARLTMPCTQLPPKVEVSSIETTFEWNEDVSKNTRMPGTARLYLDGDWYGTGDGELVAIIVSAISVDPNGNAAATPTLAPVPTSWIGGDPFYWFNSAQIKDKAIAPFLRDFERSAADVFAFVSDQKIAGVQPPDPIRGQATMLCYVPHYDRRRGRWYIDLSVTNDSDTPSYMSFIGLSIARYQPNALRWQTLSEF